MNNTLPEWEQRRAERAAVPTADKIVRAQSGGGEIEIRAGEIITAALGLAGLPPGGIADLPIVDPAEPGRLWNDRGSLRISAGPDAGDAGVRHLAAHDGPGQLNVAAMTPPAA